MEATAAPKGLIDATENKLPRRSNRHEGRAACSIWICQSFTFAPSNALHASLARSVILYTQMFSGATAGSLRVLLLCVIVCYCIPEVTEQKQLEPLRIGTFWRTLHGHPAASTVGNVRHGHTQFKLKRTKHDCRIQGRPMEATFWASSSPAANSTLPQRIASRGKLGSPTGLGF